MVAVAVPRARTVFRRAHRYWQPIVRSESSHDRQIASSPTPSKFASEEHLCIHGSAQFLTCAEYCCSPPTASNRPGRTRQNSPQFAFSRRNLIGGLQPQCPLRIPTAILVAGTLYANCTVLVLYKSLSSMVLLLLAFFNFAISSEIVEVPPIKRSLEREECSAVCQMWLE